MKNEIISIIQQSGYDINQFILGEGATGKSSFIHFRPYKDYTKDYSKEYSVQFYKDIVAIWEIGKRIKLNASINLSISGYEWKSIDSLIIKNIKIANHNEFTQAAAMPICLFESYLLGISTKFENNDNFFNCIEGEKYSVFSNKYERDARLRKAAIEIHGTRCMVCDFSFEEKYGAAGKDYIEVHHIKPISMGIRSVNPQTDLVCLCSNCHRMIHRKRNKVLSVEELSKMINR